ILAILADGDVGMHTAAVDANHWLWQEARRESHVGSYLAANQFVKLNLVGGGDYFTVSIIDFELRRRHFRVIFFVLECHRALHFRGGINKRAQRIDRKSTRLNSSHRTTS